MDKPVTDTIKLSPETFSMRRKQAIELMNQGIAAASGPEANAQMGYQLIGSAVDVDPTLAHAWFAMGNANSDLGLKHAAIADYRRALACPEGTEIGDLTPQYRAKTLCNMAHTLYHMGKHEEAYQASIASIEIDSALAFGWINKSMVEAARGQDEDAIASARKSFALAKAQNPSKDNKTLTEEGKAQATIEVGLAFSLLHSRQYAKGLKHFEARFPYKLRQFLQYPYPQWHGEHGVDLFLVSDQGLGDSIDFLRFVPMAAKRCNKVILGIQPELLRLCRDMFTPLSNVECIPLPQPFPPMSHWSTLMSIPTALNLSDDEIINTEMPPFQIPEVSAPWKTEGKKLHVGVAWAGSPMNDVDAWRSVTVEQMLELSDVSGVQFYSVQIGERSNDLHRAGAATIFKDLSPYIRDVTDTLGVFKHLDLLITVDSAPGHIAGIMDLPCWIPASFNGTCWRFTRHGDSALWFKNHHLFRQTEDADWKPVIKAVKVALAEKVSAIS